MKLFQPEVFVRRLTDLPDSFFIERGIKTVLLDVDNTLVPKGTTDLPEDYLSWILNLQSKGLEIYLCSNNFSVAALKLAKILNCSAMNFAMKPFLTRIKAIQRQDLLKGPLAMIGDQLFTDMVFGYRLKAHRVLVEPLSTHDWPSTRVLRILEKWLVQKHE